MHQGSYILGLDQRLAREYTIGTKKLPFPKNHFRHAGPDGFPLLPLVMPTAHQSLQKWPRHAKAGPKSTVREPSEIEGTAIYRIQVLAHSGQIIAPVSDLG